MGTSKKYIPSILREQEGPIASRPEGWGIGVEDEDNGFGMSHGMFDNEIDCLEIMGERKDRIIHFKKDDSYEVTWRWSVRSGGWVSLK